MSTDTLWQRTQIGFLPVCKTSQRQVEMAATASPSQLSSQLQFNMGIPVLTENMATRFRKPQPIVIEKLEGPKQDGDKTFISRIPENYPLATNSSTLSSERLAFALNLAKRDIKRAKLMPSTEEQDDEKQTPVKSKVKRTRREDTGPKETMRYRVHKTLRHNKEMPKAHGVHFYPSAHPEDDESHHTQEIRKLRKELNFHMKKLQDLQHERPEVLKNKDKRMKRRKENVRLSDDEIDERQGARSEEQAVRTSRMLYTLQRQIRDLQDELNKQGKNVRHTKKSQTLHRLAAAHRAALRALQTFISQTPLRSKAINRGPDMYQDLAVLVRQLSLLTTQLQIDTDEQMVDIMANRDINQHSYDQKTSKPAASKLKPGAFFRDIDEASFRRQYYHSPPTKDKQDVAMKKAISPNPSPERDAVLRAGLQALVRAREEALNTEKHSQRTEQRKNHDGVKQSNRIPAKKSVLLPAQLKAKRQRIQPSTAPRIKPAVDINQAGFIKDTVSSTLRKVETIEHQPPKSPPRTPTPCPQRGTPIKRHSSQERLCEQVQLTPKSPAARRLEDEFKSPRSPKYPRQMAPEEKRIAEREIARQVWLDREAELRMQEMEDDLRYKRHQQPVPSRDGLRLARQMIKETEEAIINRLQPLLDRAEDIVSANMKHEEMKKRSLQRQLTDLTTRTTLDQAHLLADEILDDILDETVLELQRLEVEEEAEVAVSGLQNRSSMEMIMQRLQSLEKGENDIRRHWSRINYDDIESTSRAESKIEPQEAHPQHPEPIRFSKQKPKSTECYLNRKVKHLNKRARLDKDKERFRLDPDESPRDSDSTASLLEGISTARSSASTSRKASVPRPTIILFVPSELRTSIAAYRSKYERYLRDSAIHVEGSFNPWKLADQISEELLDGLIQDVAEELCGVCDEYTENMFAKEFIAASDTSHTILHGQ